VSAIADSMSAIPADKRLLCSKKINEESPALLLHYCVRSRFSVVLLASIALAACAGRPPGAGFPKHESMALAHTEDTALGSQFADAARGHPGDSAFREINVGADGFRARAQIIDAAQRTLDLQYYIFRGDETGRMLTDHLLRAADRGVRIRVLVDDGDTVAGDEQILRLNNYRSAELRIYNPGKYRGHVRFVKRLEFVLNAGRLDYRMHNKLLVADNAVALIGGRNIGNQYFQIDPESQFADDDVFAAGPIVPELSRTFDEFWNSALAIPADALGRAHQSQTRRTKPGGIDYAALIAGGEPFAGIMSGKLPLAWAPAQLVYDSPDKKQVVSGEVPGALIVPEVEKAIRAVQSEMLLVTPYLVPSDEELQALKELRERQVRVRILSNSLESCPEISAQSGYDNYRLPLLKSGVELYEVRSLLGSSRGSGQSSNISRYGNYALHGKLYVFDREKVLIGSMNFDQRSQRINTEIGLIIGSPEISQQTALRFESMVKPENCYALALSPASAVGKSRLTWRTEENNHEIEYDREPARSGWQRLQAKFLSLLPVAREL
jgi:cardiolipin synthase C